MLRVTGLHLVIIAGFINLKNWFDLPVEKLPVIGLAVPNDAGWVSPVLYTWFAIALLLYAQNFFRNGISALSEEFNDVAQPHYESQAVMSDYERVFNGGEYSPGLGAKLIGAFKLLIWYPIKLLLLSPIALGFLLPILLTIAAVASVFLA